MTKAFNIKEWYANIPLSTRTFLQRALIIFIIWKLLYHLVLFPINIPDRQLTFFTAKYTGYLLSAVNHMPNINAREEIKEGALITVLYSGNHKLLGIANSCNGLELIVLYIAFLFCLPSTFKRQLAFLVFGTIGIIVLNVVRCYGLALLFIHNYSIADFAHKYLFKMIVYGAIFYAWVIYSKKAKHV